MPQTLEPIYGFIILFIITASAIMAIGAMIYGVLRCANSDGKDTRKPQPGKYARWAKRMEY